MALVGDVFGDDIHGGHRLNCGLRCRGVVAPPSTAKYGELDLCNMVEQTVEAGAQQVVRDSFRQRVETGPGAVVVVQLEAGAAARRAAEEDHRVKGRTAAGGGSSMVAAAEIGRLMKAVGGEGSNAADLERVR